MTERSEQLISMFLQNPFAMTEQQRHELSLWITQDTGNTREFIKASLFHRCVHDVLLDSDIGRKRIIQGDTTVPDMSLELFDKQLWEMLLKEEETAPEIEIEHPAAKNELIQYVKPEKITHRYSKTVFMTLVTAVAALILLIIYVRLVPNTVKSEVATLTDSINAQWAESDVPTGPNARLTTNHAPLMLRKGYAELVFDNNAKIVLEAPVEFQVLSYDQIKLSYGRLYATVPNEARGFIVSTSNSEIIDLGTEFGVQADFNGNMELHVTKGKTVLTALGQDEKSILDVIAGQARKVTVGSSRVQTIPIQNNTFVRKIDSKSQFVWKGQPRLSLTDLLMGGNGYHTSTAAELEYNPLNGMQGNPRTPLYESGTGGYVKVSDHSCIDGIFIPNGKTKPVTVSSAGHSFEVCPETSGLFYSNINILKNWKFYELTQSIYETYRKDASEASLIYLHSNIGITFDLQKVRQSSPGLKLRRFNTFAGTVQTLNNNVMGARDYSEYDVWVLVDGQVRFSATKLRFDGSREISIELSDQDRFLSLAVTDGQVVYFPEKPANHFDTCGFADPEFEVELK